MNGTILTLRTGTAFDPREEALCSSSRKYEYPTKGLATDGTFRFIVNSDDFPQGVTITKCSRRSKGQEERTSLVFLQLLSISL